MKATLTEEKKRGKYMLFQITVNTCYFNLQSNSVN